MEESEVSRIFPNEEFGFWTITVERPLRLRIFPERQIQNSLLLKKDEYAQYKIAIASLPSGTPLDDWTKFAKATGLKATILKRSDLS